MLLSLAKQIPVAPTGVPYPSAKLYLYQANTTTTFVTYQDGDYSTPHAQPVVADINGTLPAIHINPASSTDYRQVLKTSADVEIWDVDDIASNPAWTGDLLPKVDAVNSLGSSVKRWVNLWLSSALKIKSGDYTTTVQQGTLTANRTVTLPDADVTLGALSINTQNADYTFAATDVGRVVYHSNSTAYTYTIPTHADVPFPLGTVIEIENRGTNTITIAKSTGVTLSSIYSADSALVMAARSSCTIKKMEANVWVCDLEDITGSFTATLVGFSGTVTGTILYTVSGKNITLYILSPIEGTSSDTFFGIEGIPLLITPATAARVAYCDRVRDDVSLSLACTATISINGGGTFGDITFAPLKTDTVVNYLVPAYVAGFTASGTKGLRPAWTLQYQL